MLNDTQYRPAADPPRFLTRDACRDLIARVSGARAGGGTAWVSAESDWIGNLRWARNRIISSGDVRTVDVKLTRTVRDATSASVAFNRLDDASVHAAVRRAERLLRLRSESPADASMRLPQEPVSSPAIWSDATYGLDADRRAAALPPLLAPAIAAGALTAGYFEVAAHGRTVVDDEGLLLYHPYTAAQYTVTVRTSDGRGSGWAGMDHHDWSKIDVARLSASALDKCLRSRDPVALEPGRYTTILEPQAVGDFFASVVAAMDRVRAESDPEHTFGWRKGLSKLGQKILDERIDISADPADPDCGFPPFGRDGEVYHPVRWIERGVLTALAYDRAYGIRQLGRPSGLPNSGAFRMSGGPATLDEMIASTTRGIYVTRFSNVSVIDSGRTLLTAGYTRDGTWLIENGKVAKAIKNFRFTESPMYVGNNVELLGAPRRIFHPRTPIVAPAMKVKDFNFTQLSDAV